MLMLWSQVLWGNCETPLMFRDALPQDGAVSVAPTTRPFLSFIGTGNSDDLSFSLQHLQTDDVAIDVEGACYIHESDTEYHCNWELTPQEALYENASYTIRAFDDSGLSPAGWSDIEFVTTTTAPVALGLPSLTLTYFGPRDGVGVDSCDWEDAYTHEFLVNLSQGGTHRSRMDVFFVDQQGSESYVHTMFVSPNQTLIDFRQVVTPGSNTAQCHYVVHHSRAGGQSPPSAVLCHDGSDMGTQTQPEPPPVPSSEPESEPAEEPAQEPTQEPSSEPESAPTQEPTTEPESQPAQEPSTEDLDGNSSKGGAEVSVSSEGCGGYSMFLLVPLCGGFRRVRRQQVVQLSEKKL